MDYASPLIADRPPRDLRYAGGRVHRVVVRVVAPSLTLLAAFCAGALWAGGASDANVGNGGRTAWQRLTMPAEGAHMPTPERFRTNLVFSDEFEELDVTRWKHEISACRQLPAERIAAHADVATHHSPLGAPTHRPLRRPAPAARVLCIAQL
jgi:hypothetical protein